MKERGGGIIIGPHLQFHLCVCIYFYMQQKSSASIWVKVTLAVSSLSLLQISAFTFPRDEVQCRLKLQMLGSNIFSSTCSAKLNTPSTLQSSTQHQHVWPVVASRVDALGLRLRGTEDTRVSTD